MNPLITEDVRDDRLLVVDGAVIDGDKLLRLKVMPCLSLLVDDAKDVFLSAGAELVDGVMEATEPLKALGEGVTNVAFTPIGIGSNICLKLKYIFRSC